MIRIRMQKRRLQISDPKIKSSLPVNRLCWVHPLDEEYWHAVWNSMGNYCLFEHLFKHWWFLFRQVENAIELQFNMLKSTRTLPTKGYFEERYRGFRKMRESDKTLNEICYLIYNWIRKPFHISFFPNFDAMARAEHPRKFSKNPKSVWKKISRSDGPKISMPFFNDNLWKYSLTVKDDAARKL